MPDNLNLTPERGPNVWDKPLESGSHRSAGSAVGGALILAAAAATAFFGGRMLYRAVKGGAGGGTDERWRDDQVEEESADSFPASDAPSWTARGATLDARHGR